MGGAPHALVDLLVVMLDDGADHEVAVLDQPDGLDDQAVGVTRQLGARQFETADQTLEPVGLDGGERGGPALEDRESDGQELGGVGLLMAALLAGGIPDGAEGFDGGDDQVTPSGYGDWGNRAELRGERIVPEIGRKVKLRARQLTRQSRRSCRPWPGGTLEKPPPSGRRKVRCS